MTNHFNRLTEAEAERLAILIEECAEVQHVACKVLRHGYESINPKANTPIDEDSETNREGLARECGDLMHALSRMTEARDISLIIIAQRTASKPHHILPYLHHQPNENNK